MCPEKLISDEQFEKITFLSKQAVLKMHNFSLLHIGLNSQNGKIAEDSTNSFCRMFSLPKTETEKSYFAGSMIEIMKESFLGEKGHIGISTDNLARAMAYFENNGYKFIEQEYVENIMAYFSKEIDGFAIHLKQKF